MQSWAPSSSPTRREAKSTFRGGVRVRGTGAGGGGGGAPELGADGLAPPREGGRRGGGVQHSGQGAGGRPPPVGPGRWPPKTPVPAYRGRFPQRCRLLKPH